VCKLNKFIQDFLTYITSLSIITLALGYLAKVFIENYFNKGLKKYEAELSTIIKQDEIRFSKLHEERALIIKEIYNNLVDLRDQLNYLTIYYKTSKDDVVQFTLEKRGILKETFE
jgi:hypothetical protein